MTPYTQGQFTANCLFGLTKTAAGPGMLFTPKPGMLQRGLGMLKKWMPTWSGTKKFMIGEPGKFKEQLINRKLLAKGGLIREGFRTPDFFSKAMFYGLPALDVVSTLRSDSPDKAGDIANIVGGSAGSMALFRPFGMVGAMAGGMAGGALAKGLVSKGRQVAGMPAPVPAEQQEQQSIGNMIPYRRAYPYASGISYLAGGGGGAY